MGLFLLLVNFIDINSSSGGNKPSILTKDNFFAKFILSIFKFKVFNCNNNFK